MTASASSTSRARVARGGGVLFCLADNIYIRAK
jgi:hypothetical protein